MVVGRKSEDGRREEEEDTAGGGEGREGKGEVGMKRKRESDVKDRTKRSAQTWMNHRIRSAQVPQRTISVFQH
jgi:hypothetical protein